MARAIRGTTTRRNSQTRETVKATPGKEARINFIASGDLDARISTVARAARMTKSDVIREALQEYILKIERKALEETLEEGYKANYSSQARLNDQWEAADIE